MVLPVLKWPGGKRSIASTIISHMPNEYDSYYEPFAGGLAVYLQGGFKNSYLSDINPDIINLYKTILNQPELLIEELNKQTYANTKEQFLTVRSWDRDSTWKELPAHVKAARTIYLNRTCFNGLYRVNGKGQFNSPYGYYPNPLIKPETLIREMHSTFTKTATNITLASYDKALASVGEKDIVYLDPPYVPASKTASFTSYTKDQFKTSDQEKLAQTMKNLDSEGAFVIASNSDTPLTREIYEGFHFETIEVARRIGANKESRINVGEVLIIGKTLQEWNKKH